MENAENENGLFQNENQPQPNIPNQFIQITNDGEQIVVIVENNAAIREDNLPERNEHLIVLVQEGNNNEDLIFVPPPEVSEQVESQNVLNESISSRKKKRKSRSRSKSQTPIKKKISLHEDDDDGATCPICLDQWEMSGSHRLTSLKCGHLFGHACIKRWVQERPHGEKCCPSCKTRCSIRDFRFIYAKRICAVDNTEEHRLRDLLDAEKKKNIKLEGEYALVKIEMAVTKKQVVKMESEIERLRKGTGLNAISMDASGIGVSSKSLFTYKLFMEKNIEISKDPGCRVMVYGRKCFNLLVSQKSSQSLFPGYGVRFIDTKTFRPTNFLHMSTNQVRDLCFNATEDLLISATTERGAKLFNVHDRSVVNVFTPGDKPLWACALDKETNNNFLYLGSQHGSTYVYDIRNPNTVVREFKYEGEMSPVINICPIPLSNNFPFGGFLVCKLQSVWFYEYGAAQQVIMTKLNVQGPFVSMSYEPITNKVLISTRPSTQYAQARYIIACIIKLNDVTILDITAVLFGSKVLPVMSRCTQICVNEDTLIAGYLHDMKLLSLWDSTEKTRIQSLPMNDIVFDTCPIYNGEQTYLAALTECKCRIYKVNSTAKY